MSDFFNEFQKVTKTEWEAKIISDLKGKDPELLRVNDPIEELNFSSYVHQADISKEGETPGSFPFTRGMNKTKNNWNNGALVIIQDEKEANQKALNTLNSGANLIVFKSVKEENDWQQVIAGIEFEHIEAQFICSSPSDFENLRNTLNNNAYNIQYNLDFIKEEAFLNEFDSIAKLFKTQQQRFCSVNGFKLQQAGATTWQEIAFCLSTAHEYLVRLMSNGLTIDEASACISFKIGIGANYFYATAKHRALKQLWAKVIQSYTPSHDCTYHCSITSVVGHMNKSLADRHTNLLRQTTEAMSAINAGIDDLVVLPYDLYSTEGSSVLAERMALNLSTLLLEESYLDKVIDPSGGSYSIENLTELIAEKAWTEFQIIDKNEGLFNADNLKAFTSRVNEKKAMRIAAFISGDIVAIGINKFPDPDSKPIDWIEFESYLGLSPLVYENEYKTAAV